MSRELARPCEIADTELRVTASIGTAVFPIDGVDGETLLAHADTQMYRHKRGRSERDHSAAPAPDRSLSARLESAVRTIPWTLRYQPIVELVLGRAVGAEALIRWPDASGVEVPPSRFIPLAEEMGLISTIGSWIVAELERQLRAWRADGTLDHLAAVTTNVSPRQLWHPGLLEMFGRLVDAAGRRDLIVLEITESALGMDPGRAPPHSRHTDPPASTATASVPAGKWSPSSDASDIVKSIHAMLHPRNIVLVGATDKPGNYAERIWNNLIKYQFEGGLYPVNSKRETIWGVPCYKDFTSLPDKPDHVLVLVPARFAVQVIRDAAAAGARPDEDDAVGILRLVLGGDDARAVPACLAHPQVDDRRALGERHIAEDGDDLGLSDRREWQAISVERTRHFLRQHGVVRVGAAADEFCERIRLLDRLGA